MSRRYVVTTTLILLLLASGRGVHGADKPALHHRIVLGAGERQGKNMLIQCDPPSEPNPLPITVYTGFTVTLEEANCAARNQLREELPNWVIFTDDVTQDVGKQWHIGPYKPWEDPELLITILSRSYSPGVKYAVVEWLEVGWRLYFEDWHDMDCNDVIVLVVPSEEPEITLEFEMPVGFQHVPYNDWVRDIKLRATDNMLNPVPELKVKLTQGWELYTGGHLHCEVETRPDPNHTGVLNPDAGETDEFGIFYFDFRGGTICGVDSIKAKGVEYPEVTGLIKVMIKYDPGNWSEMAWAYPYELTGDDNCCHPRSHFGTQVTCNNLAAIAWDYFAECPPQDWRRIHYNDMSITWGGLFDLGPMTVCNHDEPDCQFWQTPHSEHRFGKTCDVQKAQILHPDLLEDIFRRYGVYNWLHYQSYWHVRFL